MKLKEWEAYVSENAKSKMDLAGAIIGLAEETGEVAGWYKKAVLRANPSFRDVHLAEECGDVLYYLTRICHLKGWNLKMIMDCVRLKNDNKLRSKNP